MIINYLIVLFFFENLNYDASFFSIFNTVLLSTTLLKENMNIIKIFDPRLNTYINKYNNELCTIMKQKLVNYIIKENIEMIVNEN